MLHLLMQHVRKDTTLYNGTNLDMYHYRINFGSFLKIMKICHFFIFVNYANFYDVLYKFWIFCMLYCLMSST